MYTFILTARHFGPKKCKFSLKKFDFMQFWNCMLATQIVIVFASLWMAIRVDGSSSS